MLLTKQQVLAALTAFVVLIDPSPAVVFSQLPPSAVGPRIDFSPGFSPSSVQWVRHRDLPEGGIAVSDPSGRRVLLYSVDSAGGLTAFREIPVRVRPRALKWGAGASGNGILVLDPEDRKAAVVMDGEDQGSDLIEILPADHDQMAVADLNNDRTPDVLFYGRQGTGITLFWGKREGGYDQEGRTLLPDLSVSDLAAADINGDTIPDLFVTDWLSNRISLFLGIGRGVFSEQNSITVPREPDRLTLLPDPEYRESLIAATFPELSEVHLFAVSSLGEIRNTAVLKPVKNPGRPLLTDFNADGIPDLLVPGRDEFIIFIGMSGRSGYHRIPIGLGGQIAGWTVADVDRNGSKDILIVTSKPDRVILLSNARHSAGTIAWPARYAVPARPRALAAIDIDGDNFRDLVVLSPESGTCSVLMNEGTGELRGAAVLSVEDYPRAVKAVTGLAGNPRLLISHRDADRVTVLRPLSPGPVDRQFSVPTDRHSVVLTAGEDRSSGFLSFLTRNGVGDRSRPTISVFEQISGDQFTETTIKPTGKGNIGAIASGDLNDDRIPDLFFTIASPERIGVQQLLVADGTDPRTFRAARVLHTLVDSAAPATTLRAVDLDRDGNDDIVVCLGPPANALHLIFIQDRGTAVDSVIRIADIGITRDDGLVIDDLDGDGWPDFCFIEGVSRSISTVYNEGSRRFGKRKFVAGAAGVSAIAVARRQKKNERDLIILNEEQSTVSVRFNAFAR